MRIVNVSVLNNKELLLHLDNESCKIFKMEEYLEGKVFKPLKDINELKKFKLEFGCIEWECGASLSEDTLLSRSVSEAKSN
ncbi:DUF2442 domain-containing protein [Clostridium pasteurianum]|uniref:DUF2442 domain-containing protein n=1 Tax=Clostridium pasteurianum TaxID=1501 RepID=UPI002260CC3C|nr:DUF2442 domain-containing protein [Clostridium pasteurianum]UZW12872.1 DUF2442 domain-containing protein [Clostridium pasteurianum]